MRRGGPDGPDEPVPIEHDAGELDADEPTADEPWDGPEEIEVEITDVFDLHTFRPNEVPDVVRDYLDAAWEKGLRRVRIIHGRGKGVQRRTVRTLLERDPRVVDYGDMPGEAGGWGATWVRMG